VSARLPAGVVVSALLRRVNDAGGLGVVRARGDAQAGGILVILEGPERARRVVERGLGPDGDTALIETGPRDSAEVDDYWRRRRSRDPDLWVIELDIAGAERFAAETILGR
jgi:hypothetical protein